MTMAPWTWRHTDARMEIMPDGSMEIMPECSMEIKHVDEVPYHITHYLNLMLVNLICASI
jgi:hypothetical protein